MTINYTTLLGLAQPVTGTEQGTWGDTVNTEITALLEDAIADAATFSVTSGDVTLTSTAGQANQARMAILLVTGTPGVSRNIIAPSQSKWYIVKNSSDASVVLKGSATTGVTILAGTEALCFWNGSDFEIVGVNGPSSSTDNAVVRFDGTTGKVIQNSGVIIDDSNNVSGMGTLGVGAITTTGVFTATAGTVSAPAITTTGDTNTGIFFPAADTIAFAEGGVEAMRIASSGNVRFGVAATNNGVVDINTGSGTYVIDYITAMGGRAFAVANGQTIFSDGFASAPAISFVNDPNTGIFGTTLDVLGFSTGGSERMRIDSSGNVGIGTSSPVSKMDFGSSAGLSGTAGVPSFSLYSSASTVRYGLNVSSSSLDISALDTVGRITFYTGANTSSATERMRIDSSGNVGIGATNPDIFSFGSTYRILTVQNTATNGNACHFIAANGTGDSFIQFTNQTYRRAGISADSSSNLTFATNGSNSSATGITERMRIDSSGNVGIGTTNPLDTLHVSTGSTTTYVRISNSGGERMILSQESGASGIYAQNSVGASSVLKLATGSTERMRIDTSGNVGIGTSTTTSVLNIGGTASAGNTLDAIAIRNTSFGDAIFAYTNGATTVAGFRFITNDVGSASYDDGSLAFFTALNASYTEKMRVRYDGYVGIGTTAPNAFLEIKGGNGNQLYLNNGGQQFTQVNYLNNGTAKAYHWYDNTNDRLQFQTGASGGVYLANGGTSWTSASDERLKDIIEPIKNAVDKVSTLRSVIGKYKTDEENKRRVFLIAQDVQTVLPEAVDITNPEEFGLSYTDVIPLLVAAIKEQTTRIEALEAEVAAMKGQ